MYHVIRADADREEIFDTLEDMVANDVIREYADKHAVYAPVEVDVPPPEECPTLEEVRKVLEAGEEGEVLDEETSGYSYNVEPPNQGGKRHVRGKRRVGERSFLPIPTGSLTATGVRTVKSNLDRLDY